MTMTSLPPGKLPLQLVERLLAARPVSDPSVVIGPSVGHDAAAVRVDHDLIAIKTDPITFATEDIATYLVNVNANDLACLGVRARWLLVTALFPEGKSDQQFIEQQFTALQAVCDGHNVTLVGGHTEITIGLDRPIMVGTMIGDCRPEDLLHPGQAKPGHRLLLTKSLAIEGTALLAIECEEQLQSSLSRQFIEQAAQLLRSPGISVVADAFAVLPTGAITALHDPTEGGFATGVRELALSANCGAHIDFASIPISPETLAICEALSLDPLGLLASGSLLIAASPDRVESVKEHARRQDIPIAEIGVLTPHTGVFTMQRDGATIPLPEFARDEVTRAFG